jgi:hypothetical protein
MCLVHIAIHDTNEISRKEGRRTGMSNSGDKHSERKRKQRIKKNRRAVNHMINQAKGFIAKGDKAKRIEFYQDNG